MAECDICKDNTWVGQYHCLLHGVWYRDDDQEPSDLCPVGQAEEAAEKEIETLNGQLDHARRFRRNCLWANKEGTSCELIKELESITERVKE